MLRSVLCKNSTLSKFKLSSVFVRGLADDAGEVAPAPAPEPVKEKFIVKGIHEPEYLDWLKPRVPHYGLLNVQVKGYDFRVLDEYCKHVYKLTKRFRIEINNMWAVPHQSLKIESLLPESRAVDQTYFLNVFERNIQIKHLKAKLAPLYIQVLQACKPAGVTLSVHEHSDEHTEIRYIPDMQLAAMEKELEEWKQPISVLQYSKKVI